MRKRRTVIVVGLIAVVILVIITGSFVCWRLNDKSHEMEKNSEEYLLIYDLWEQPVSDQESALQAIEYVADLIGIGNVREEFKECREDVALDNTYYRFAQEYEGISVYGRSLVVSADSEGNGLSLTGNYKKMDSADIDTKITEEEALKTIAASYEHAVAYRSEGLVLYSLFQYEDEPELAWKIFVAVNEGSQYCFVSAKSGEIIAANPLRYVERVIGEGNDITPVAEAVGDTAAVLSFNTELVEPGRYHLIDADRNIAVYNSENKTLHSEAINGELKLFWREQEEGSEATNLQPVSNAATWWEDRKAVTAMTRVGAVYDFYSELFDRKGFNNQNGKTYVVYNDNKDNDTKNAYSDYGITGELTLLSFGTDNAMSYDVVGHEYTHSVEQSISGLQYINESGALMEAYGDIFGEIFEDWVKNKVLDGDCDWDHNATRNMENPKKYELIACNYEIKGSECDIKKVKGNHAYNDSYNVTSKECCVKVPYPVYVTEKEKNNIAESYDYGGVHINTTLISHAAYLMYAGKDELAGHKNLSMEELARLFYSTLFVMPSDCTFSEFRSLLENNAAIMYRQEKMDENPRLCVEAAMEAVGIGPADVLRTGLANQFKLSVLDINGDAYTEYEAEIYTVSDGERKKVKADLPDKKGNIKITLEDGIYEIVLTDQLDEARNEHVTVMVGGSTEKNRFRVRTDFGDLRIEETEGSTGQGGTDKEDPAGQGSTDKEDSVGQLAMNTEELVGQWIVDTEQTESNNGTSMRSLFGSAFYAYGSGMEISEDHTFSYYIGAGLGGEGTWNQTAAGVEYTVTGYEEGNTETGQLKVETYDADRMTLVMDLWGNSIFWVKADSSSVGENKGESEASAVAAADGTWDSDDGTQRVSFWAANDGMSNETGLIRTTDKTSGESKSGTCTWMASSIAVSLGSENYEVSWQIDGDMLLLNGKTYHRVHYSAIEEIVGKWTSSAGSITFQEGSNVIVQEGSRNAESGTYVVLDDTTLLLNQPGREPYVVTFSISGNTLTMKNSKFTRSETNIQ